MIRVNGHELWRGGEKIGYVYDNFIKNHEGDKLGYFQGEFIYDINGHKEAYVQGDFLCFLNSSGKLRLEDINKDIAGGDLNNMQQAAVRVLLGE